MTAAISEPLRRLAPVWGRMIRLLRSAGFKVLIGVHLAIAAIVLVRGYGGLQPFELLVYDALTGNVLARPSGDWPPQHVTFAGRRAYVTSGWSGTLRVHRIDGKPLVRTVVPVGSYNVQHADGWVLTPSLGHGSLSVLDDSGRVLRSEKIARSSHDACVVTAA